MEMDIEELVRLLMQCAKNVRKQLGAGYQESVYKNAMIIEQKKHGLGYEVERPITVYYDQQVVGEFRADIIVEDAIILELKAVSDLHVAHEIQLVNYLTSTGIDNGLLINFGSDSLQFKRKFRVYKKNSCVTPPTN